MVPKGGIINFAGSIASIPGGWQLCDGTNGTPDLRARFVRGAGPTDPVNEEGGANGHTHTFDDDGHVHAASNVVFTAASGPGRAWESGAPSSSTAVQGNTSLQDNRPAFWTLAYIQRMV